MSARPRLYRVGQRVSVRDASTRRWRLGQVVVSKVGRITVAELGSAWRTWHVVPPTPAWIRPIYIVQATKAAA